MSSPYLCACCGFESVLPLGSFTCDRCPPGSVIEISMGYGQIAERVKALSGRWFTRRTFWRRDEHRAEGKRSA